MAAHRSIERDHADPLTVTASAPMDGPLELAGVTVDQQLASRHHLSEASSMQRTGEA
jgi:hypothetical protein